MTPDKKTPTQWGPLREFVGVCLAALTFIVGWIYAIATGGFILGLGLGWLPAAISAVLVFYVWLYLWPVVLGLLILGTLYVCAVLFLG